VVDSWFKKAFGAHYPLLYAHRDIAEAKRCLELLPHLAPLGQGTCGQVLDLGCGDGRHLELLVETGHRVVGLDLSAELLALARSRLNSTGEFDLVRGDMRRLPFSGAAFSAVLSLFTAFGYFGSPEANQEPVGEVARVLVPGGHWFLDYFDGDKVRAELGGKGSSLRERDLGPLVVREERELVEAESLVAKRVHLEPRPGFLAEAGKFGIPAAGLRYTERVAVFTLKELDTMADKAGMSRVAAAGGYNGELLGEGNRWVLVFRKNTKDTIL
jgi:SAM-dependent methyltransferase